MEFKQYKYKEFSQNAEDRRETYLEMKHKYEAISESSRKSKVMESAGVRDFKTGEIVYVNKVIYNNPVTVVIWTDGTKTTTRCTRGDTWSPITGLAICYMKKTCGNEEACRTLENWESSKGVISFKDVRKKRKENKQKLV